eukprot:1156456-Pelagomonas_calceolata.AAC.4
MQHVDYACKRKLEGRRPQIKGPNWHGLLVQARRDSVTNWREGLCAHRLREGETRPQIEGLPCAGKDM